MRKKSIQFALDEKGRKIVVINQILFYGKKKLPWNEVEKYLKRYIGKIIEVAETRKLIHIASDFPDEYNGKLYLYDIVNIKKEDSIDFNL